MTNYHGDTSMTEREEMIACMDLIENTMIRLKTNGDMRYRDTLWAICWGLYLVLKRMVRTK